LAQLWCFVKSLRAYSIAWVRPAKAFSYFESARQLLCVRNLDQHLPHFSLTVPVPVVSFINVKQFDMASKVVDTWRKVMRPKLALLLYLLLRSEHRSVDLIDPLRRQPLLLRRIGLSWWLIWFVVLKFFDKFLDVDCWLDLSFCQLKRHLFYL